MTAIDTTAGLATDRDDGHAGTVLLALWALVTAAWWALALAPVADPPAWLAAAREVCFGSSDSGLPDTRGWIVLAAGPGSMLAGILGVWGRAIRIDAGRATRTMSGRLTLAIVAVALAIAGAWAGERIAAGRRIEAISYAPASAEALPTGYPRLDLAMPALALTDQDGAPFTQASFAGKPTILTFAFAHCHTVCPVVVDGARRAAERIGEDRVRLAVVTLDPWRDTPSRLQSMHANWRLPASARVLSGSVEDVTAALDALNVGWQRDEDTGDVTHPPLVYLVDADGRIAFAFSNPPVPWLAEAMDRLAGDEG